MAIILPNEHVELTRLERTCRMVTPAIANVCPSGTSFALIMFDGRLYSCSANISRHALKALLLGMVYKLQKEGA